MQFLALSLKIDHAMCLQLLDDLARGVLLLGFALGIRTLVRDDDLWLSMVHITMIFICVAYVPIIIICLGCKLEYFPFYSQVIPAKK